MNFEELKRAINIREKDIRHQHVERMQQKQLMQS